jgi:hypothetical protein
MNPAVELLAHMKQHYFNRIDPASPEALAALLCVGVVGLIGVWLANRRTGRRRSGRPRSRR